MKLEILLEDYLSGASPDLRKYSSVDGVGDKGSEIYSQTRRLYGNNLLCNNPKSLIKTLFQPSIQNTRTVSHSRDSINDGFTPGDFSGCFNEMTPLSQRTKDTNLMFALELTIGSKETRRNIIAFEQENSIDTGGLEPPILPQDNEIALSPSTPHGSNLGHSTKSESNRSSPDKQPAKEKHSIFGGFVGFFKGSELQEKQDQFDEMVIEPPPERSQVMLPHQSMDLLLIDLTSPLASRTFLITKKRCQLQMRTSSKDLHSKKSQLRTRVY